MTNRIERSLTLFRSYGEQIPPHVLRVLLPWYLVIYLATQCLATSNLVTFNIYSMMIKTLIFKLYFMESMTTFGIGTA